MPPAALSDAVAAASPDAAWTIEPGAIALILILGALYVRRWRQVRARDGARAAGVGRLLLFLLGLLGLVAALISPIDRLAEQILAMHMVQHVILLDLVPICLILGLTKAIMRPLTRRLQPIEHGPLGHPALAAIAYIASMWVWHIPALYDAAAKYASVHVLEHVFFLTAGVLYWWHLVGPLRTRLAADGLAPVGYMLSTKLGVGLLGILLTFAPEAIYAFYAGQPEYWGLTPTADQSVAGVIMALEQSIVMGIALAWLFARMLTESEKAMQREERYGDLAETAVSPPGPLRPGSGAPAGPPAPPAPGP
ncbi:MAG: cytochrome c oxidase assembly protein [Solirubrobacteraceae bacterium]|nr:cytochrome c oxidase assembly protein [Solirubrobacteraceae bacterium]